jgi:hypothetical protein
MTLFPPVKPYTNPAAPTDPRGGLMESRIGIQKSGFPRTTPWKGLAEPETRRPLQMKGMPPVNALNGIICRG